MHVGEALRVAREAVGVTRTAVAERMGYPGGAIKAIEEGRRTPKQFTVSKYLYSLAAESKAVKPAMYNRFHAA